MFLFGTGIFIVCLPSLAHAQFEVDIIKDLSPSQNQQAFWDELWKVTFDRSQGLTGDTNRLAFGAIGTMARWVTLIALFVILIQYMAGVTRAKTNALDTGLFSLRSMAPVILILVLMANNFAGVHGISLFANQWRQTIKLEAQKQGELGATFRDAIQDQYFADQFRRQLGVKANYCNSLEKPLVLLPSETEPQTVDPDNPLTNEQRQLYKYLNCVDSLKLFINIAKADLEKRCAENPGPCKASKKIVQQKEEEYASLKPVSDFLGQTNPGIKVGYQLGQHAKDAAKTAAESGYRAILDFIQWAYQGFLEFGFYLSAVAAPIVFAISLIPGKRHYMYDWMFALLTFSIAEFFYIISLGIVSLMLQTPGLIETGGKIFPLTYGLLAPIVSGSMLVGGFRAASSFRGGVIGMASAVGGAAGGIATSIAIAGSNRRLQHY